MYLRDLELLLELNNPGILRQDIFQSRSKKPGAAINIFIPEFREVTGKKLALPF